MQHKKFDPDKAIDYNMDYYAVLGLEKGCLLPLPLKTKYEREIVSNILEGAYRLMCRRAHPDFPGGSPEKFKLLVRAHTILSDPLYRYVYESGGIKPAMAEDPNSVAYGVNWDKLGTYRQGTLQDTVGFNLYLELCEKAKEADINLVPAFYPKDATDSYEWNLAFQDFQGKKVSLSIVQDEEDVLRLTAGENIDVSLPFKIYICIPRSQLTYLKEKDRIITEKNGKKHLYTGKMLGAMYSDYELLETTQLEVAKQYIDSEQFKQHLISFRDGSMAAAKAEEDKKLKRVKGVQKQDMNERDINVLRNILRAKSFRTSWNPTAADFLKDLPDSC